MRTGNAKLVMIDNYDSFTYNIVQYIGELGWEMTVWRNDQVTVDDIFAEKIGALVVSPGPCSPLKAGVSCDAIRKAGELGVPTLGICLGFQCIGEVYGGIVAHAPYLMHGKVSEIFHNEQGIFKDIPSPFKATRYHSLAILPDTVPECLEVTAKTSDGVIMGGRHKTLPIHGVQFHPESVLTEHGHQMLANFLEMAGMKTGKIPEGPRTKS